MLGSSSSLSSSFSEEISTSISTMMNLYIILNSIESHATKPTNRVLMIHSMRRSFIFVILLPLSFQNVCDKQQFTFFFFFFIANEQTHTDEPMSAALFSDTKWKLSFAEITFWQNANASSPLAVVVVVNCNLQMCTQCNFTVNCRRLITFYCKLFRKFYSAKKRKKHTQNFIEFSLVQ